MVAFIIKYWKIILAIICFIISAGAGFYISNKIWILKYNSIVDSLSQCNNSLSVCNKANEENLDTIEKLRNELKAKQKQCDDRILLYKNLLKEFKKIDSLTGGVNVDENNYDCPDDICYHLNRMWK